MSLPPLATRAVPFLFLAAISFSEASSGSPVLAAGRPAGPALLSSSSDGMWVPIPLPDIQRVSPSLIYDPVRQRAVMFGGNDNQGLHNQVWVLSLEGLPLWTPLVPGGTPPSPRWRHTAIYDPIRDRMIVFGGETLSGFENDVWELSFSGSPRWTRLVPSGSPPGARSRHVAIYDPARNRMLVHGGNGGRSSTISGRSP